MFVKPGAGRMVRVPPSMDVVPEEGKNLPPSQWLFRRLRCGDLVKAKPAPKKSTPKDEG